MKRKSILILLLCLGIVSSTMMLCGSKDCWALVKKLSLENLTNRSSLILIGKVTNLQSSKEEGKTIITDVTITPENFVKSSVNAPEITVRILGGEVGDIGLKVSTEPDFKKGERVLLFLEKTNKANNIYQATTGIQGKYTINANNAINTRGLIPEKNIALDKLIKQIEKCIVVE